MNKKEKQQFRDAWLECENIITLIEPSFVPENQFKRPEEAGPEEIKLLLQFLRIQVRLLLHDKESTQRECMSLSKIVSANQQTGEE